MVVEILGVAQGDPTPKTAPPVEAAYHRTVPELAVASKFKVPVPHLESGVVNAIVGRSVTVAVTGVRLAEVHAPSTTSA